MVAAILKFYNIKQCGLYDDAGKRKLGSLSAVLEDLLAWAITDKKPVKATNTFSESDDLSVATVYIANLCVSSNDDYFLETWNEVPSIGGSVPGLVETSIAGSPVIKDGAAIKGTIPGYPTYFWFMPDKDMVATITFQGRRNGMPGLTTHFSNYIFGFSKYVVRENPKDAESTILGYSANGKNPSAPLEAAFFCTPSRKLTDLEFIRANRSRISKIVRKSTVKETRQKDLAFWQWTLSDVGLTKTAITSKDLNVKYEIKVTPSEKGLERILSEYQEHVGNDWEDIGFQFKGEQGPRWLSQSRVKYEVNLSDSIFSNLAIDITKLRSELTKSRDEIFATIFPSKPA